jgi:hypothetical protein
VQYNLSLKKDREALAGAIERSGAEVVIYDCLSNMHTENENDNAKMRMIVDVLGSVNAKCGTACVLVHHFAKPSAENTVANKYRIRGAQSISDWAFTIMAYSERPGRGRVLRELEITKVRDGIKPSKPMVLERDENLLLKVVDNYIACPSGKVREILLQEFGGHVKAKSQLEDAIMEYLECSRRSAWSYVKNALNEGSVYRNRNGKCVEIFASAGW